MTRSLRAGCVVVSLLSAAFVPLDFTVFRESFVPMLSFRLFCNGVMLVIIFRTARTHPLGSAIVGCLTTGAMLLTVIAAAGGLASDYTPGLMLLFLGMPVLLPFTARQAGAIVAILAGALAGLPFLSETPIGLEVYSLNLIFPVAAGVESVAACALLERMRFADFLGRREIEQARDDLKALDREKSRFTANIHHELRTPLTLMLAPVDALLAGDFGEIEDLPRSYLETVRSNGFRLLNLINNLLDLAKIESQSHRINRQAVLAQNVIKNLLERAQPLAEQKGISIETIGIEELPRVSVDPDSFEKVLTNLISNALKFTNRGGHLEIRGEVAPEGGVTFSFADDGIGIAEDQIERIFDRFAQVDTSQTKRYEGTGIGLSLVRELVELHGGHVWAESPGLGCGTTLHLMLPCDALRQQRRVGRGEFLRRWLEW